MRLKNYTDIDTERLKEIIRFVKPAGVTGFDISFKNSGNGMKGKAYWAGTTYHSQSKWGRSARTGRTPLVVIGVYTNHKYPRTTDYGKGYLASVQFTVEEDIVHLVAHELRHLWQAIIKRGWRVWGARGQFSERDADAYAIKMTRAWRREKGFTKG